MVPDYPDKEWHEALHSETNGLLESLIIRTPTGFEVLRLSGRQESNLQRRLNEQLQRIGDEKEEKIAHFLLGDIALFPLLTGDAQQHWIKEISRSLNRILQATWLNSVSPEILRGWLSEYNANNPDKKGAA